MRTHLEQLKATLEKYNDQYLSGLIEKALAGTDDEVDSFLVSNELWGGAGSVADQGGLNRGREAKREIESILIALGEQQIRNGKVNVRTAGWVDVFKKWKSSGI